MKKIVLALIVLSILPALTACSTIKDVQANAKPVENRTVSAGNTKKEQDEARAVAKSIVDRLTDDKVTAFYKWEVDTHTTLFCIVRNDGKGEFPGEPTTTLYIMDGQGRVVYQEDKIEVESLKTLWPLRKDTSQLLVETNGGGRVTSFEILDYVGGEIVELLDGDGGYQVCGVIKPQFRSGVEPSEEPYEILLTDGVGLASPAQKDTSVYRYNGESYEFQGEFPQKLMDDYMEKLLKKYAKEHFEK